MSQSWTEFLRVYQNHDVFPALMTAVLATPHDDLPKLVMADFLDEHGQLERAEFIRLSCILEQPTIEQSSRKTDLLAKNRVSWRGHHISSQMGHEFLSGFVGHLAISPATFLRAEESLFDHYPIYSLDFLTPAGDSVAPQFTRISQRPNWQKVKNLDLAAEQTTRNGYTVLENILDDLIGSNITSLCFYQRNDRQMRDHGRGQVLHSLSSLSHEGRFRDLEVLDLSPLHFNDSHRIIREISGHNANLADGCLVIYRSSNDPQAVCVITGRQLKDNDRTYERNYEFSDNPQYSRIMASRVAGGHSRGRV